MAKSTRALVPLAFALSVVAPAWASAQAGARTAPPGSTSTGSATSRPAAPSGSSTSGSSSSGSNGSSSAPRSSNAGSSSSPAGSNSSQAPNSPAGGRDRNGRQIIGTATPRTTQPGGGVVVIGSPWYPSYFGNVGYYGYNAWAYGYSPWAWYNPYDPYYSYSPYSPYGAYYGVPGYDSGGQSAAPVAPSHPTGAIRLKVNPDTAMVFVDGGLVGKAGDFDGLTSHHLVLERGSHLLEIRADGYQTFNKTVMVEIGKTMTERIGLKKK